MIPIYSTTTLYDLLKVYGKGVSLHAEEKCQLEYIAFW